MSNTTKTKSWDDVQLGDMIEVCPPSQEPFVGLLLRKVYAGSSWEYDKFAVLSEGKIKHYNRHELSPLK